MHFLRASWGIISKTKLVESEETYSDLRANQIKSIHKFKKKCFQNSHSELTRAFICSLIGWKCGKLAFSQKCDIIW